MVSAQGPRDPVSKSPFLTTGVEAEHVDDGVAVEAEVEVAVAVVTTVVRTVAGEGVAVRMQEQALLSLAGGYVVAGKSRFALPAETVVLWGVRASTVMVRWC